MTTLDNGLRVVTDTVNTVHSVALGIWTAVGTRHEDMTHNGIAHMVEHMLFKGTKTRSTTEIAESIEDVGGHMNAYTSREVTSYHIHLLREHVPLALEVLADMYQHSVMPEEEVERERQVILQEIGMCADTPDDLVFDHYYETAYPQQALGAPILGRTELISGMKRSTLMDYVRHFYSPKRTILAAAGNIDHDDFVQTVAQQFTALPADTDDESAGANYQGGEHRLNKDLEQSHIVLGFQGLSRLDKDFHAAQALSILLGGGMASRLFQEVREKRGLVYSIYAFHSGYRDSGQFAVYAGTGPDKLTELVPVVCDEILKVAADISDEEISRTRAQMKANLLMSRESMMTRANQIAKHLIYRGRVFDLAHMIGEIEAIDRAALQRVASRVFAEKPTLAALGPLAELEEYTRITERLAA